MLTFSADMLRFQTWIARSERSNSAIAMIGAERSALSSGQTIANAIPNTAFSAMSDEITAGIPAFKNSGPITAAHVKIAATMIA